MTKSQMKRLLWLALVLLVTGCSNAPKLEKAGQYSEPGPVRELTKKPGQRIEVGQNLVPGRTNILYFHADF